jgi:hypothetical protein
MRPQKTCNVIVHVVNVDINITPRNIGERIHKGALSSTLLIAILSAMDKKTMHIPEFTKRYNTEKTRAYQPTYQPHALQIATFLIRHHCAPQ